MTVVMSYHALIERDSKYVDNHWKIITCFLLCAVAFSAFLSSFNLNEMQTKYNNNCFLNANLQFTTNDSQTSTDDKQNVTLPETSNSTNIPSNNSTNIPSNNSTNIPSNNSTTNATKISTNNSTKNSANNSNPSIINDLPTKERAKLNIYELKNKKTSRKKEIFSIGKSGLSNITVPIYGSISNLSAELKIDEIKTNWGRHSQCFSLKFVPIVQAYIAIIWLILFMMCGNGGKGYTTYLTKPWSIVCPAFVVFGIFTIISFAFMFYMSDKLNEFCNNLKLLVSNSTDYSCGEIFNHFVINKANNVTVGYNYSIAKLCMFVTFLLWFFLLLIIFLRIIFVIDFQLVRVTISHVNIDHLEVVDLEEKIEEEK